MALLKKIQASTLMETLVATVLIMVIFMVASLVLNNLFMNSIKNDTKQLMNRLNELEYLQQHKKIALPYDETYKQWRIQGIRHAENGKEVVAWSAKNQEGKVIDNTANR